MSEMAVEMGCMFMQNLADSQLGVLQGGEIFAGPESNIRLCGWCQRLYMSETAVGMDMYVVICNATAGP